MAGLQRFAAGLIAAGVTSSTQQAYRRVWLSLKEFCKLLGHEEWASLPVDPATVLLFLAHRFASGLAGSSLASYASAIAYLHKLNGLSDPTKAFAVHKLLVGAQKLTPMADLRLPITKHILCKLVSSVAFTSPSPYYAALLRCLFTLAFHGFFRLGELIPYSVAEMGKVVAIKDLTILEGKPALRIQLRHSKNKPVNQTPIITLQSSSDLAICPVLSMRRFLAFRGLAHGPIFVNPAGFPITKKWFNSQFNLCLQFVGLDVSRFKGHSFRIGAASEAAAAGFSDAQIRHLGRWKSDAFKVYIRIN